MRTRPEPFESAEQIKTSDQMASGWNAGEDL